MNLRRTTVAADPEALATLESEARRRGVSLTTVMAEAIAEKAAEVRSGRRPRVGIAASTDGGSAAKLASEPVAHPPA